MDFARPGVATRLCLNCLEVVEPGVRNVLRVAMVHQRAVDDVGDMDVQMISKSSPVVIICVAELSRVSERRPEVMLKERGLTPDSLPRSNSLRFWVSRKKIAINGP